MTETGGHVKLWALLLCLTLLAACGDSRPPVGPVSPKPAAPAAFKADPQTAGTVTGKVTFTGKKAAAVKVAMNQDPACMKLHQTPVLDAALEAGAGGALANVFVYVKQGLEGKTFDPPAEPAVIDQRGCWFGPRVLGVQVGQTLKVTNSDPLTHNIHPMPEANREWNQSQEPGAEPLTRRFMQPEVMIRVKCNVHAWMHAWVGVVAHPWFAVTGADGTFTLPNLPPGDYTIETWHEQLGRQEQKVTLGASAKGEAVFRYR
ncbi:MAG: carboxypeptidase regulatory-like domain-containing protein [Blastocatellia bacterium]